MSMLLLLSLLLASQAAASTSSYLLWASPAGGLWGGQVTADGVSVSVSRDVGFPLRGLNFGALSLDPASGTLLMELVDEGGDFHGLATGAAVCTPAPGGQRTSRRRPDVLLERVRLVDGANPHLAACGGDECGWSGFALAGGGRVYFLLAGLYGRHAANLTTRVSVRVLEGCDDMYPIRDENYVREYGDHVPFPVLECSRSVAEVYSLSQRVGKDVTAGRYTGVDHHGGPDLYFHLVVSEYLVSEDRYRTINRLYRVSAGDGAVHVADQRVVHVDAAAWTRRGAGGVAVTGGGRVCHAVFTRIYCSPRRGAPFEALTYQPICEPTDAVVDGLAFNAEAAESGSQQLYVGCALIHRGDDAVAHMKVVDLTNGRVSDVRTDNGGAVAAAAIVTVSDTAAAAADCS